MSKIEDGHEEVRRYDVWNETMRMTPHTGTRINRDDSYWTVVVLATDYDALAAERANAIESAHDATLRAQRLHDELTAAQQAAQASASERLAAIESEARVREALLTVREYARNAAALNDAVHVRGNSVKAHKMLMALAGVRPGYSADVDRAYAALSTHPSAREQDDTTQNQESVK